MQNESKKRAFSHQEQAHRSALISSGMQKQILENFSEWAHQWLISELSSLCVHDLCAGSRSCVLLIPVVPVHNLPGRWMCCWMCWSQWCQLRPAGTPGNTPWTTLQHFGLVKEATCPASDRTTSGSICMDYLVYVINDGWLCDAQEVIVALQR